MKTALTGLVLAASLSTLVHADSYRLEDTIRQGVGVIDLLRAQGNVPVSPAALEALREQNFGDLVLGVDINEAAAGTEKAESQGVAVDTVSLVIVVDGVTHTFTDFRTETQSVLARTKETTRQSYYTLIGRSGSNSITGSVLNNTSIDSTLTIPVDIDISNATSVVLNIQLLETNHQLGDPETFYDETAGYEDLAILNLPDRQFLDTQQAGQTDAPLVLQTDEQTSASSYLYYPAQDRYFVVGYEDQFPAKGDYDFNDLVVAYRVTYGLTPQGKVMQIIGEGYLVARGGSFSHNWHLHMAIPTNANVIGEISMFQPNTSESDVNYPTYVNTVNGLDIQVFNDTASTFVDGTSAYTNTEWDSTFTPGQKFSFAFDFEYAIPLNQMPAAPFDPYLYVLDTGYEVHLPSYPPRLSYSQNSIRGLTSFLDDQGYPFALTVAEEWQFPNEYIDLGIAYPDFINFVTSGNTSSGDWYLNGVDSATTNYTSSQWKW